MTGALIPWEGSDVTTWQGDNTRRLTYYVLTRRRWFVWVLVYVCGCMRVCVRECLHNDSIKQKNGDSTYLDMVGLF